MSVLVLIRHGAFPGRDGHPAIQSDLPLTTAGEEEARALRAYLPNRRFGRALTSPLRRARQTAELAGLDAEPDEDLGEWISVAPSSHTCTVAAPPGRPAPTCEHAIRPETTAGETLAAVTDRAERVLHAVTPVLADGADVALVADGNLLRIVAARWLRLPAQVASRLPLSTGSLSILGWRTDRQALLVWNFSPRSWPPS